MAEAGGGSGSWGQQRPGIEVIGDFGEFRV